jgi:hypothetical protein
VFRLSLDGTCGPARTHVRPGTIRNRAIPDRTVLLSHRFCAGRVLGRRRPRSPPMDPPRMRRRHLGKTLMYVSRTTSPICEGEKCRVPA